MNELRGDGPAPGVDVSPSGEPAGGFWISLLEIFIDPQKVFGRIERGLQWWKPYIIVGLLTAAISWFQRPISVKVIELNLRGLSEEQIEIQRQAVERFGFVGVVLAPLAVLLLTLVVALLVNVSVNLVSGRSGFGKVMCLLMFTGMIGIVEQALRLVVIHMRGIEAVESMSDLHVSFGLAALPQFAEIEGFGRSLLESLSVFQIWYLVVLTIGLASVFRISRRQAVVPTIIVWLIGLGLLSLQGIGMRG